MTAFEGGRDSDLEGKLPPILRYPPSVKWPDELEAHERQFETFEDEYGAAGRLLLDRLAVAGTLIEPQPHRRHRGTIRAFLLLLALASLVWVALVVSP